MTVHGTEKAGNHLQGFAERGLFSIREDDWRYLGIWPQM